MPRTYPHSHVCAGQLVGFAVKKFGDLPTYIACFRSKDGRRLKRDTNQTRMGQAVEAARILIEKEYLPPSAEQESVTWEQTITRLEARLATSGNRASTVGYYKKLIRLVRSLFPESRFPSEITPAMAARWRDSMMSKPSRRKKPVSAHYVVGLIGGLSALWQKWLIDDLKILATNPWQDVEPPKADKLPVKYATDDQIAHFYTWTAERFGDWSFPKLFLSTKAYTGCRLMDLCSLTSAQLVGGRLVFPAGLTKGREERRVPLPGDLFKALDAFKGEIWLWQNYLTGLRAALVAKHWPVHQLNMTFSPERLYFWIETLFSDYRKANNNLSAFTTHMFRKRAFTLAWQAGVDPRRAAIAYGCNVDTLMEHYVLMDEQRVTDDVFGQMNGGQ